MNEVDATLESIASELRNLPSETPEHTIAGRERLALADAISAHARKSQPVNERHAAHALAMLALQSERYGNDPDYRDATDNVLAWTMSAAESAAPGENLEAELAEALNALLDGLDANSNESGGLSAEQWHHRIASARLVLHRFDRMEQRSDARKTEGAKPTDTQPLWNYDERP